MNPFEIDEQVARLFEHSRLGIDDIFDVWRRLTPRPVEKWHDVSGKVLHSVAGGRLVRVAMASLGDRDDPHRAGELLDHRLIRSPRIRGPWQQDQYGA